VRTLFETSWARDTWSPNLGQAAAPNVFGSIASAAGSAVTSFYQAQTAEEERKAKEAQAAAAAAQAQAQAQAAAAAAMAAPKNTILGMDPTTAAIVGAATLVAIIGGVALLSQKKKK
jgi:hypothetical protein